ncbi:hypothetical protein [Azotobacter salinestris]|uniref:hypothetical protein n=1 Tax=Azotobacter salinestris TaxID=69964 RepID=UPI001266DFBC|nr:hypothetical protein [Azotobacter salinestris]
MFGYPHLSVVGLCACFAVPALASTPSPPPGRQELIHQQGHRVMPFSLKRTLHIFRMTETGGSMQVVLRKSGSANELPDIQRHLLHMRARFSSGDFSVPASLHGPDMPGLKELEAGASRMKVTYAPLPNGGEIRFETGDIDMITAIHRWFGAQLSEHGADAQAQ